jgi:ATP-dependent helicase HrpA
MRYRPYADDRDRDLNDAIVDAVDEAHRTGPGDVLVFLPGEREIREAAEALRKHTFSKTAPGLEILPLFARQTAQEQSKVFASHQGRRVVLATNVAETSLTVPGIRYVIDTGLARVKRYSHRSKVEALQVEDVSRAAANQRAGRCGRVSSGVCFRLYSAEDFEKRAPYTDPEILRSSLAGVILRMKSLHLGDVERFPFLEAPLPRMVADGYALLAELGAIDETSKELTSIGKELAKLPLDPKIGRMILAAREHGCLREMLVIAAALGTQDPRDRPQEQTGAADQAHAKWKDEKSEFLSYLKLWSAADEVWKHETSSKQRQWCRAHFINWLRLREWRDVHGQLMTLCHEHGWKENQLPANYDAIHKALLTGLLGHIGLINEEDKNYFGARGIKYFLHPGSSLAKKAGRWIVAAELVETSRLFARCIAKIEPEWLEQVGTHLLRCHIYEPHWEKSAGQVVAYERVTLHGLTLHAKRRIHYGPKDPRLARELLIRGALVEGAVGEDWLKKWRFLQHYQKLKTEIERLEHKSRRPDVLVDDTLVYAFFDAVVPEGITTLVAFDKWRRDAEQENQKLLFLDKDQLMRHEAAGITTESFPPALAYRDRTLKLTYKHDPGAADDGVTLSLPLAELNRVPAMRLEWLVPGLLKEKIAALLKTLPQKYRHRCQPLDAFAAAFCDAEHDHDESLAKALTRTIEEKIALKLPLDALRPGELRPHLFMNIRLLDEHGATLAMSRNLAELRADYGEFAEPSEEVAVTQQRSGLREQFALALKAQVLAIEKLPDLRNMALQFMPFGTEKELKEQLVTAALESTCLMAPLPDEESAFAARVDHARGRILLVAQEIVRLVGVILAEQTAAQKKLGSMQKAFPQTCADINGQLAELLKKHFIVATPWERLQHFPRYFKAIGLRLDKARNDALRDVRLMAEWRTLAQPWEREWHAMRKANVEDPFLQEYRWLLEELRVALFAQELRTPSPVSVKRLQKMWEGRPRS